MEKNCFLIKYFRVLKRRHMGVPFLPEERTTKFAMEDKNRESRSRRIPAHICRILPKFWFVFSFVNQNPTFEVLLLCFCKSHRLRNFWIFWFISASYIGGHIVTTRASWDQLFSKKALFNLKQLILCDRSIFWMAKPDLQMGPIGLDDLEYSRCCTRKGNLRPSACSFEDRSSL